MRHLGLLFLGLSRLMSKSVLHGLCRLLAQTASATGAAPLPAWDMWTVDGTPVPQQSNFVDCGVFLCSFIDAFLDGGGRVRCVRVDCGIKPPPPPPNTYCSLMRTRALARPSTAPPRWSTFIDNSSQL